MTEETPLLIESTAEGLVAPSTAEPGPRKFRSTTESNDFGWIGMARLEAGVEWETFRTHLRDTVSDDPERIVRGSAGLNKSATMVGGAVIHPGMPADFTVDLDPGRYVLFDYPDTASDNPQPRYRFMTVEGTPQGESPDANGAIIADHGEDGRPRFRVSGTPTAQKPLEFRNEMPGTQFIEAVLFSIADDVGHAQLKEYFDAFVDGSPEWPPNPPFDVSSGSGCLPLSIGRNSVMWLPVAAGRYVVVNWLKDENDGVRLVKRGQFQIVEIV